MMKRREPSQQRRRPGTVVSRLDRVAKQLNPILVVIALGLAVLNISVFAALRFSRLHLRPARIGQVFEQHPSRSQAAAWGLPQS